MVRTIRYDTRMGHGISLMLVFFFFLCSLAMVGTGRKEYGTDSCPQTHKLDQTFPGKKFKKFKKFNLFVN